MSEELDGITRDNGGTSNYHGLTAEVNRRFSKGLQFTSSWAWSKNLSDAEGSAPGSFSEDLNASFSGSTGAATHNGGSVNGLIAGASNAAAMNVGVNTSSAGAKSGSVTLDYQTYEAAGWTITADPSGTRFTNDATGHGMFVATGGVDAF